MTRAAPAWAPEEARDADLGDARLGGRLAALLGRPGAKPSLSLPAARGGRAEAVAAYRFLDHRRPRATRSSPRTAGPPSAGSPPCPAQDTTEVDLTRPRERAAARSTAAPAAAPTPTPSSGSARTVPRAEPRVSPFPGGAREREDERNERKGTPCSRRSST